MGKLTDFQNKAIASEKVGWQIVGALLQWRAKYFYGFILLLLPTIGVSMILAPHKIWPCLGLIGMNLGVWLIIKVCRKLADIFSLQKKDSGVTWCYVSILIAIGFWIVVFVLIFNVNENTKVAAAIGVIGFILSSVFKDKITGVVAFFHLRMHHMLNIGDWIMVPKFNVDGEVKRVTLTSVTIYNWDTTTSVIPISALHADHFKNLQNMMKGKTYGRRMLMSFTFDTGWFHPMDDKDFERLQKHDVKEYLPTEETVIGVLNARLYRLYLHHWLMNYPHVSQQPRLIVRWIDQKEGGMPLEVYAFIIDSSLAPYEWQRSQIVEHIIESMEWFGLRLYQSPASYDVSNINVCKAEKPATYRKEDL